MKPHTTYTQRQIDGTISGLSDQEENLIRQRNGINNKLVSVRKNLQYWKEMSVNQYKMFEDEAK